MRQKHKKKCVFATAFDSLPQFCRLTVPLSQQLCKEYMKKLGMSLKTPYLCIRIKIHTLVKLVGFFILV